MGQMEDLQISLIMFKEKEGSLHLISVKLIVAEKDPQLSCTDYVSLSVFFPFFYTSCLKNIDTSRQNI